METYDCPVLVSDAPGNDIARNVYCIFGLPIDALDMPAVLDRIEAAAAGRTPFLLSQPPI